MSHSCSVFQVTVATAQAPPDGILPPNLSVMNVTTLGATWSPPAEPNGIITGYQLYVQGGGKQQTVTTTGLSVILYGEYFLVPRTGYQLCVQGVGKQQTVTTTGLSVILYGEYYLVLCLLNPMVSLQRTSFMSREVGNSRRSLLLDYL